MPAASAISRAVGRVWPVVTRSSTASTTESRGRWARADRPSTVWVLVIGRHRRCRCTARATTGTPAHAPSAQAARAPLRPGFGERVGGGAPLRPVARRESLAPLRDDSVHQRGRGDPAPLGVRDPDLAAREVLAPLHTDGIGDEVGATPAPVWLTVIETVAARMPDAARRRSLTFAISSRRRRAPGARS